jgi:hypothetical protein
MAIGARMNCLHEHTPSASDTSSGSTTDLDVSVSVCPRSILLDAMQAVDTTGGRASGSLVRQR